jgi:hypothetical protein
MIQGSTFGFEDTTGYTNDLQISNTGVATFQNRVNSTGAFQIETAGSTPITVLNVDTSNDQVTINANGIPLKLNETATGKENGILFQNTGTPSGEIGIAGSTNNIINNAASGDLALKAASGNILFSASTGNNSNEHMRLTQAGFLGIGTGSTLNTISRLTVAWKSGDTTATSSFGSSNASDDQMAVVANSYSNNAVNATSVSSVAVNATSTLSDAVDGYSTSGNGVYGYSSNSGTSGVTGHNPNGIGVFGYSSGAGIGVQGASSTGVSGYFQGGDSSTNTLPTLLTQQDTAGTSSANLFEAQDSSGNVLFSIAPSGLTTINTPVVPTALSVKGGIQQYGYMYPDAGGTYGGDYVELGECDITNQFQGCFTTIHMAIQSDGNPSYYGHATVVANSHGDRSNDQPFG